VQFGTLHLTFGDRCSLAPPRSIQR